MDFMVEAEKQEEIVEKSQEKPVVDPEVLQSMVQAGVLYGRKKAKTQPRMSKFICATRNGVELIDPTQTLAFIDEASEYLKDIARDGKSILVVGTTPSARVVAKTFADKFGYPVVTERWLGGTLTNFRTIYQRLQYYIKLRSDRDTGALEKYTKKERLEFSKKIEKLQVLFGGLEPFNRLPDVLLVFGATSHDTAVREAVKLSIPIVAIASTDADPDLIDRVIPANDRARASIKWVADKLAEAIEAGRAMGAKEPQEAPLVPKE